MTGRHISTDLSIESRRDFLKQAALGLSALAGMRLLSGCSTADPLAGIPGGITGANYRTGHLLQNSAALPASSSTIETDILIVGGGVSGLSARRWLSMHSTKKVVLTEMDVAAGGNSRHGGNAVSPFPYGAHYLPVPDLRNSELLDLLETCGSITGYNADGLPEYNAYHLCNDPQERLFINGLWQEGLVPDTGISADDRAAIGKFFAETERLRMLKGADGKDIFAIPLSSCSEDNMSDEWHRISFADYLRTEGHTCTPLLWYLDYCCRDDYGGTTAQVSAWAGLHYFASRKGAGTNVTHSSLLTWPQGNGYLVDALKEGGSGEILTNSLVFDVRRRRGGITALCYNAVEQTTMTILAQKAILATPVSVNKRLLRDHPGYKSVDPATFGHSPWIVANLTVSKLPEGRGMPICWDNVLYGSTSVGYINANHQDLSAGPENVITVYLPLTAGAPGKVRQAIRSRSYRYWLERIVADLQVAHPNIGKFIRHADIWIWGHGMIMPSPGFITGPQRRLASTPLADTVFFAHTDLSGISIFEEAFYQGIRAANQALETA